MSSRVDFCFLCRNKLYTSSIHQTIDDNICQSSKKPIKEVLNHLAQCTKIELHISKYEVLCSKCHSLILDYDSSLVLLLRKQKKLIELIDKALMGIDEIEDECESDMKTLDELNDDQFFDDADISDADIMETIREASGKVVKNMTNSGENKNSVFIPLEPPCELLQCTLCAMRFRSKIRLHKHIANAHKKYSCELCDYSHRNEDYVKLHMNLHEGKSENQCRYCEKEFSTKISTMRHMEAHMDTKKYQCDKCGLCFSQTTVMYNHKLQHEAEEQPLRCEICAQVFKTKRTFRHHMITHRADRPRHSCEYCGKTFTEKYTLKVHKRTHHEHEKQNSIHEQSEETKTLNINLNVHSRQIQEYSLNATTDSTKLICIICNQSFNLKDQLNKHMEKEHDVILKSLSGTNYTQYEVVSNESKKSCDICDQMFNTQSSLEYHILNVHGNEYKQ